MAWAKLHTDILGDPKLMRAARKGVQGLEWLPWLIAFAKQADDDGRLTVGGEPADPVDISDLVPGATAKTIARALNSLEKLGILTRDDDETLRFSRWHERSGGKPSDAPSAIRERVTRHRARKSLQDNTDSNDSNALQGVSRNATEKRREEEKREEGEESARVTRAPRPRKPARAFAPEVQAVVALWQAKIGATSPAKVEKLLGPAITLHGETAVCKAVDAYAQARATAGKPARMEWFAEEAGLWVERSGPIVDPKTGMLNERGLALLGGER